MKRLLLLENNEDLKLILLKNFERKNVIYVDVILKT